MNTDTITRVAATIDVPGAAATTWDVIVIGAGPGGAFAARESARAGLATLLVDRATFPRAKPCGGCLNHTGVEALQRAGLGDRLAGLGGHAITTVHLLQDRRRASIGVPPGVALSRRRLDAMLVAAAVESGVQFLPETTAVVARDSIPAGPTDHRVAELRFRGGPAQQVIARIVVAADGLAQTSLRACGEFESRVSGSARIGVGSVGPADVLSLSPGTITMAIGQEGYVGAVRVEEDQVDVGAALDAGFLKQSGSPGRSVATVLNGAGIQVSDGLAGLDWLGTLPLTRRTPRPVGRRVLVVGDAAGYVEPFTGEGMTWALATAGVAMPFIRRGLRAWDESLEREWITARRRLIGHQQRTCRILSRALRAPWAVRAAIDLLGRWPSLAHPVVTRLGARFSTTSAEER